MDATKWYAADVESTFVGCASDKFKDMTISETLQNVAILLVQLLKMTSVLLRELSKESRLANLMNLREKYINLP
jgi:hypothetical protein